MMKTIKKIWKQRNALSECGRELFTGDESIEQLAGIFASAKGREFCLQNGFPGMKIWRELVSEHDLAKLGVYVDSGNIELTNERFVAIIGDTRATLRYDKLERHQVMILHGAHADVIATDWAMVAVEKDANSSYTPTQRDRARIL